MIPLWLPMNTQPARCPYCHNVEKKVEICDTCRYEYPEADFQLLFGWLLLAGLIGGAAYGVYSDLGLGLGYMFASIVIGALVGVAGTFTLTVTLALICLLIIKTFKL
jgi:hypothetical protein